MDKTEKAQDIKRHPQISKTTHQLDPEKSFGHCTAEAISVTKWAYQIFDKTELKKNEQVLLPEGVNVLSETSRD